MSPLRAYYERFVRMEEEREAVAADMRDLYAEAKASGFETKAMRAAFRLQRARDDGQGPAIAEHEATVDLYLADLSTPRVHAHVSVVFPNDDAADAAGAGA